MPRRAAPLAQRRLARRRLAQPLARAPEALVHVRLAGEEPQRDLAGAESAQRLEREDQPGLRGDRLVAADEQHPQHVVAHLAGEIRLRRRIPVAGILAGRAVEEPEPSRLAPEVADQAVVGDPVQPRARIVGHSVGGPVAERGHEGGLDRVLHHLEMLDAGHARERRDQASVFVPEEVLDQARLGQDRVISRISTRVPGITIPGPSFATSSACS